MKHDNYQSGKLFDFSFKDGWKVDGWLFTALIFLLSFSTMIVFSASGENAEMMTSHMIRCLLAIVVFVVASRLNVIFVKQLAAKAFVLTVVLLIAVACFGDLRMGARRWLDLGLMSFQPSELAKLTVPMMCALIVAHMGLANKLRNILLSVLVIVLPSFLVLLQPDLGTAIMIAFSGFAVLFFSGLPMRLIGGGFLVGAAASPILWYHVLRPYQRERIMTVFNPEADPLGAGYHVAQAKAAIGSGGLDGVGWLEGTQTHLGFIPEQHTDFIFAVIGEEFGFIGFAMLMVMYLFLMGRVLSILLKLDDIYAKSFIGGILSILFAYIFVNVGMVIGILPVVGVPLPLISYGGTATLTMTFSLGLVSAYSIQKMKHDSSG
ncbi:rod shape-determining protein RodA [Photobacterium galatheae]|uniref:Peptidoglycan glycosyltransferase MrdB n=1 Tax=Photobacterium galatheae TaxID=1654360 RepID=A0A066RTG9_9GAMM|nr:rod shape-determining protein RodA [Photobacterium galatheae]KDM91002.1 hypothetical protein EA58_14725 [Photobacterium galatheae]MCM0149044.1 rod shape-determining protein RodA [Photobacterium galatheae]